jgi:uncharacterized membrane protein YkoI
MFRILSLLVLNVAVTMLGAHAAGAAPASWTPESDAAAYGKGKVSLIQAIAVANRTASGRPIHADFQMLRGKGVFKVTILEDHGVATVTVDAETDQVIDTSRVQATTAMTDDQRKTIAATANATFRLENAAAQGDEMGDWAVDAGVDELAGTPAYRVDVLKDGKIRTIMLDIGSGKPLPPLGGDR